MSNSLAVHKMLIVDTNSENVSLIWPSVSDGEKTCSSKGVSLVGIFYTQSMQYLRLTRCITSGGYF